MNSPKNLLIFTLVIIIVILAVALFNKKSISSSTNNTNTVPAEITSISTDTQQPTEILLYNSIPLTLPAGWTYREDKYQSPGMQSQGMPPEIVGYTFYVIGSDPMNRESITIGGRQFPTCAYVETPLCDDETQLLSMGTSLQTTTAFESIRAQLSYAFQDFSGQ